MKKKQNKTTKKQKQKRMKIIIQEHENIVLKFDVILLQMITLRCKFISLKTVYTSVVGMLRHKIKHSTFLWTLVLYI